MNTERQDQDISNRIPPEVNRVLKRKKEFADKRGRDFTVRQPRQIEPRAIERSYQQDLRRRIAIARDLVRVELIPNLESAIRVERQNLPTQDALADDLFIMINGIRVRFAQLFKDTQLREIIRNRGLAVSRHNLAQFRKVFRQAIGVDPFKDEPWLRSQIDNFVEQNVALIKSVDEQYFSQVQETVFRGARQGKTAKEIAKEIRKRGKVAKSRSELIARDQVNKFNGQLNQLRQQDVGVTKYRWRTSLDERVRPEHASREGKVFSWDDPPSDGHPGEPIQCRCYAEPIIEDLIEGSE